MGLRPFLKKLKEDASLTEIHKPISKNLEISGLLKALDGRPVLMHQVNNSSFPVAGNLFSTKALMGKALGISPEDYIPKMLHAIENPSEPTRCNTAPCQERIIDNVDLNQLPILFHFKQDGGNYITSGVSVITDQEYGQNLDFHRLMQIGKNKFSMRVVSSRHFDIFLKKQKKMPMAVCIGNGANVLLAAATSVALGQNELEIANSLAPLLE